MFKELNKDELKTFTSYKPNNNAESKLYIKEDIILKLLLHDLNTKDRRNTILTLNELNYKSIPTHIEPIKYKSRIGYISTFYKTHQTLDKFIYDKSFSIEERKKLINLIAKSFEYLRLKEFLYKDIHYENFIYDGQDLKIVDLDSGIFKSNINKKEYQEFEKNMIQINNRLSRLYLQIMFGNYTDRLLYSNSNKFTESQKEYLLHANDRLDGIYNPESEINSFDKENIRKLLNLK
jgi:hypothetical protein